MYNNINSNIINNCCCTCGLKKAICIIEKLGNLVDSTDLLTVYYDSNLTVTKATLQSSDYPNLVRVIGKSTINNVTTDISLDLCLEYLNAICINPASNNYQLIINELNKDYSSIMTLNIPCNENCCCKYSFISFFKDTYTQMDPADRSFKLGISGVSPTDSLSTNKLNIIHCDYDVAWLLDTTPGDSKIYLVPLCKIYGIIK